MSLTVGQLRIGRQIDFASLPAKEGCCWNLSVWLPKWLAALLCDLGAAG